MRVWDGAKPRLILVIVGLCALQFQLSRFKAADTLPVELNNETFRTIVSEMSEAEVASKYTFDNFVSNELYFQTVLPLLRQRIAPGGVYVGVGPEQNFTYVAALRARMAFVIDIRRQNMMELLMYKAIFEMSPNRADFVSLLFSRKRPDGIEESAPIDDLLGRYENVPADDVRFKLNLQAIEDRLKNDQGFSLSSADIAGIQKIYTAFRDFGLKINFGSPGASGYNTFKTLMTTGENQGHSDPGLQNSFLANEENYRYIRSMEQKNLIVPLVGDFGGPKTIRAVGTYVREHGSAVTAFYMSNVTGYMNPSQTAAFFESVGSLPLNTTSTFIRAAGAPALGRDRVPPGRFDGYFSSIVPILELLEEVRQGHIRFVQDIDKLSY